MNHLQMDLVKREQGLKKSEIINRDEKEGIPYIGTFDIIIAMFLINLI